MANAKNAKIYIASSWRNEFYADLLPKIRADGHEVYDFRDPDAAFKWSAIDENWKNWSVEQYKAALRHPEAVRGFIRDSGALEWCDTCVLLLPAGASAHTEFGWACGQKKRTAIFMPDGLTGRTEADLMYKYADLITDSSWELIKWLPIQSG